MQPQLSSRQQLVSASRRNAADAAPIDADTFARLIGGLEPFEKSPRVAAAVSGGADSLCLAVLLAEWVKSQDGSLMAFHVDHRLRPESTGEAAQVADTLKRLEIDCEILTWDEARLGGNLQERAREARYRLLEAACLQHGFMHLALGHQANDQCETVRMRAARGRYFVGLSGMADLRETREIRVIRPLLSLPRARIEATLRRRDLGWLEDPSNRSPRFERNRLRNLSDQAFTGEWPADSQAAQQRRRLESDSAYLLAHHTQFRPEGWAILDWPAFEAAETIIGRYAVGTVLRAIGGKIYLPPHAALDRFMSSISQRGSASLHGTLARVRGDKIIIWREWSRIPTSPLRLEPASQQLWDGRFLLCLDDGHLPCSILPLGAMLATKGAEALRAAMRRRGIAASIANSLPVVMRENGLWGTPTLACAVDGRPMGGLACLWRPRVPLTSGPHHSPLL
ncbi:tRNA(Ile)-lysidine synthase [Arboricoccus pini]|uniref:tRNA(Ile)-lysidine synthase n=1 Tax=Arboricoccus pini TaxID=1963835 RepID=A0A212QT64_9PROT|nr:tRNA(Ile)-lysidine synthase [Arboricoccus pini]